jgi:uncharacterized membrane protein YoaK (UPF0700 family)
MLALALFWLMAQASQRRGPSSAWLLLLVQFLLLTAVLIFSILARSSADTQGLTAGITAMITVSAMACQYAVLRLVLTSAISTAVMTGNLINAVLAVMDLMSGGRPLMTVDRNLRCTLLAGAGGEERVDDAVLNVACPSQSCAKRRSALARAFVEVNSAANIARLRSS